MNRGSGDTKKDILSVFLLLGQPIGEKKNVSFSNYWKVTVWVLAELQV